MEKIEERSEKKRGQKERKKKGGGWRMNNSVIFLSPPNFIPPTTPPVSPSPFPPPPPPKNPAPKKRNPSLFPYSGVLSKPQRNFKLGWGGGVSRIGCEGWGRGWNGEDKGGGEKGKKENHPDRNSETKKEKKTRSWGVSLRYLPRV